VAFTGQKDEGKDRLMSLAIVFKGTEGIVLAADSRVTLTAQLQPQPGQTLLLPSTFDNATKLLKVAGQDYVGAVCYGLAAIGVRSPRTIHSYLPEFEEYIKNQDITDRIGVEPFCQKLSDFFMSKWNGEMPPTYQGEDIVLLIGGFDIGAPYGRIFEVKIPSSPIPHELLASDFGAAWGGQRELTDRLLQGYDPNLPGIVQKILQIDASQTITLEQSLKQQLSINIPYQFLPLQDCVDLSIFLIRATIMIQKWQVGIRGVGGMIDAATITQRDKFNYVQQKRIRGESNIDGGLL